MGQYLILGILFLAPNFYESEPKKINDLYIKESYKLQDSLKEESKADKIPYYTSETCRLLMQQSITTRNEK